jgi:cytochrome c-type biogenesis protein CcmH
VRGILVSLCLVGFLIAPAHAVQPDEILKDPVAEARARQLSTQLRCLVCQNESIDDSNAPLAKDLRLLVRERITAGDSDEQVKAFLWRRSRKDVAPVAVAALSEAEKQRLRGLLADEPPITKP